MSKLFETLGMEWCLSKITNSAKTNILIKKAKKKKEKEKEKEEKVTKKMYLPKIIMNQPWSRYLLCERAPIDCVQVELFSKLNVLKEKKYIYIG